MTGRAEARAAPPDCGPEKRHRGYWPWVPLPACRRIITREGIHMPDEMQHLETILQQLGIARRETLPELPEPQICPICNGAGYLRYDVSVDDPRFGQLVVCQCTQAELQARRQQILLDRSRLRNLRHLTFDS